MTDPTQVSDATRATITRMAERAWDMARAELFYTIDGQAERARHYRTAASLYALIGNEYRAKRSAERAATWQSYADAAARMAS